MTESSGKHHHLGNGYRLDLVSDLKAIVLRRGDGSEVARFSGWGATSNAIEQSAEEEYRTRQREPALATDPTARCASKGERTLKGAHRRRAAYPRSTTNHKM